MAEAATRRENQAEPIDVGPRVPADALLEALPLPVMAVDGNLRIAFANAAAAELFGLGQRAMRGLELAEIWGAKSVAQALVARVCKEGAALSEDSLNVPRPDGTTVRVSLDATPLETGYGGGVAIVLRDRTIAERLDRQVSRRDGARSFGAMAAMLAHEVRNPLSGIRGAAQLLAPSLDVGGREMTEMICQEVDRIVAVLNTVETLASGSAIETAPQNIHEILDYVCNIASAGVAHGRHIVREYDPSLPPVDGDRALLIQAFFNLVKNAAEATETIGGEIRIVTRFESGLIHRRPDGGRNRIPIVVSITDDGSGIADNVREHLFDPFMTTKPHGRGLGLALVGRIVADHDGAIDIRSEPRRTTFEIMLPVAATGSER